MEEYLQQITRLMNLNGEAVEGMMVVNKDGIVEYYKPGNPFGKLPEEFGRNVVGNHLLSVYTELSEENSTVMNTLRTGQITVGEKQVLTHEDLQITMVTTTYPILNQQGEIQGAVDIAQILDVRSLKGAAPASADHSVLDDIVTRNKEMARLKAAIRTIAKNDSATLIYGETGTGKELFAEALHALSGRRDKPFLSQNCAAIPENLLESMFFGTERGGFTGAESKKGLFELADGGTLFLDEINSMPVNLQGKVLRAIETKTIQRIGATKVKKVDFRLLSATNEDLERLVEEKRFRPDLYYRLAVIPIRIPPLRERKADIIPLAQHFLNYFCEKYAKDKVFTQQTLNVIHAYDWPGNVRELKNFIERSVVMSMGRQIEVLDVSSFIDPVPPPSSSPVSGRQAYAPAIDAQYEQMLTSGVSLEQYLERCEREYVGYALRKFQNSYKAADALKTSQSSIMRRKKKYFL